MVAEREELVKDTCNCKPARVITKYIGHEAPITKSSVLAHLLELVKFLWVGEGHNPAVDPLLWVLHYADRDSLELDILCHLLSYRCSLC